MHGRVGETVRPEKAVKCRISFDSFANLGRATGQGSRLDGHRPFFPRPLGKAQSHPPAQGRKRTDPPSQLPLRRIVANAAKFGSRGSSVARLRSEPTPAAILPLTHQARSNGASPSA